MELSDKTKMIAFFERNVRMVNTNHKIREITFAYVNGSDPMSDSTMTFKVITENSLIIKERKVE